MPTIIRPATLSDKQAVLQILDDFNDYVDAVDNNPTAGPSKFSTENSGDLLEAIINSDNSVVFVAAVDKNIVGFLEIHAVPRLRRANYYAEIESMFVGAGYRGTGLASSLMESAIEWARQQKFDCIRLYTGHKLERAHAFYEKMGFTHAGRTYKYSLFQ